MNPPPTDRTCFRCRVTKPVAEFYRSNSRYYQRECKKCNRERKGRWHQTEIGKRSSANTKLKARFGITLEEYEQLVDAVGKRCEICGALDSGGGHRLAIDHDHQTNDIRGILCKGCNVGLGRFRDSIVLLESAIAYLKSKAKTDGH